MRSIITVAVLIVASIAAGPPETPVFRDVAEASGVRFRFDDGSRGKHDLPEIMGGGVALIDADGDGRLDIFLCNGGPILPRAGVADPPCRLYLNRGGWTFEDVTDRAEAPGPSYAMGAAVGDYDGDGRDDLFVTGWRDQRLYRNLGGGRFADVTARVGLASDRWSTSAAFADLDGDGDLDLYVGNYVDYDPALAPFCAAPDGVRDYCGPEVFPAQRDRLYRNDGGTFTDISVESGIALTGGRGLGVLVAELTGDDRLDLFVANDGSACRLFANQGGLRFAEVGEASGLAYNGTGEALAGMGVARGDLDGDGQPDLLVANFLGRATVGFRNLGGGLYADQSAAFGLTKTTRDVLGFGLGLDDFDGDGDLDLLQANGHVLDRDRLGVPFAMRPLLLRNDGGRFVDASAGAGPWFGAAILGRGVAVGDLDGDGRPDAVVNALDAPAAVLRNVSEGRGLTIVLEGRETVGASVRATIGDRQVVREIPGGGSYLSASSREVHIGLKAAERVERLEVAWPSGRVEHWEEVGPGPLVRLAPGTGKRVSP